MLMQGFEGFDSRYKKDGLLSSNDMKPLLVQVYGREPPEVEIELFIKYVEQMGWQIKSNIPGFEITSKFVDAETFAKVIAEVRRELSQKDPDAATEYKSNAEMRRAKETGHTSDLGPRDKYRVPVLMSHDYGWPTPQPFERVQRMPKKTCEETRYAAEMVKGGLI